MLYSASRCYRVLQDAIRCYMVFHGIKGCYTVLEGATRCYMVLHGVKGCYTVAHGVSRCYRVLLGVTLADSGIGARGAFPSYF